MTDPIPDPLPREWLPDAAGPARPEDPQVWEERLQRLVAAAEPRLARLRAREAPWWASLAGWWRPAGGLALAAAAALALVLLRGPAPGPRAGAPVSLALGAIASEGDPAVFWTTATGREANPVLALVVLGEEGS